ncbi:MAG TPA: EamA family transporter [Holophagaceae bacterium]|nr:EamA family transporter [Holophagaceae bacterium]
MPEKQGQTTGLILVALSGLCFGLLPVFNRQAAAAGLGVPTLLSLRFLLAGGALWAWLLLRREPVTLRPAQRTGFVFMGLLYTLGSGLYFYSSRRIPVALTALLLYVYPALVALWEWAAGRHPLKGRGLVALLCSLAGTALAVGSPGKATDPWGLLMALLTALTYTVYMVLGARLQKGVPALLSSAWIITSAGLLFLAAALASGSWQPLLALKAWKPLAGLAVLCTLLPIPLLLAGMARIGAARASVMSTLEPLGAAFFGAVLLSEWLRPIQWIGGALILAAVILLSSERSEEEPLPEH